MIIVLNLWGGLCNQISDLYYAINYFINININYTINCCTFRDDNNIELFFFKKYHNLFNKNILSSCKNYIIYENIKDKINNKNKLHINKIDLNKEILDKYIIKYKHKDVFLFIENFYKINLFLKEVYFNFNFFVKPNIKILKIYNFIKNKILQKKYNFIHLRFENDFKKIFGTENIFNLDYIIKNIKFKNNYKIYLACSDISKILNNKNRGTYLYKDDLIKNFNLNFEEKAFIDLLIGKYSEEFYGNRKSSFSLVLSILKNTKNFYN